MLAQGLEMQVCKVPYCIEWTVKAVVGPTVKSKLWMNERIVSWPVSSVNRNSVGQHACTPFPRQQTSWGVLQFNGRFTGYYRVCACVGAIQKCF